MGSFVKFSQAVPEILQFLCSKKTGFFRQDLRESLHTRNGTKKVFFLQMSGNKHS